MKKLFHLLGAVVMTDCLCNCSLISYAATTSGEHQEEGTVSDCGSFRYQNFRSSLRVTPKRFGENSLLAYQDLGPGAPRNEVFFMVETDGFKTQSFAKELRRMDPQHPTYWNDAILESGDFRRGAEFWGYVPEISKPMGKNGKLVQRGEVRFIGQVVRRSGRQYLQIYLDQDVGLDSRERAIPRMKKSFKLFQDSIRYL